MANGKSHCDQGNHDYVNSTFAKVFAREKMDWNKPTGQGMILLGISSRFIIWDWAGILAEFTLGNGDRLRSFFMTQLKKTRATCSGELTCSFRTSISSCCADF